MDALKPKVLVARRVPPAVIEKLSPHFELDTVPGDVVLGADGKTFAHAADFVQAVRAAPGNGVWWMGLGISLQAEKRNAEALEAFQKARASGALSAELAGFVERRIQQLAH